MKSSEENRTESVEKRSVSGPKELFDAADAQMSKRMMNSFSEYVRALIREDLHRGNGAANGKPKTEPQLNLID